MLLLVLFVQGAAGTGYLYLERNWIEAGVVQSLKNVSSMHQRSFDQLERTLDYQFASISNVIQDRGDGKADLLALHTQLQKEVKQVWLDTVAVLDPEGNIVDIDSDVPLESVQLPHSLRDLPAYRTVHDSKAGSLTTFVPRPHAPELGGGGIAMFRAIKSPEGHSLGTVVGFTALSSLSALLNIDAGKGFDLGKHGLLGFIDQHTHTWLYRYVYGGDPAMMNTVPSQVISPALFQDTRYGPDVKFAYSPVDGEERLIVLAPLRDGHRQQVVGASMNTYLHGWRIQVLFSVLVFAGLAVLQWLLLGFFQRNRQQRALLDLVLSTVDACVYFKTSERSFTYVNANTAALFGLPAEQIIGRRDSEVLPQKIADDFWVTDNQVLTSGSKQNCTEIAVNPEGKTIYYSSIKVPVHLPGQPPALVGISTDITELHEQTLAREAAEKALAAHNHYLWLNNQVLEKLSQNAPLSEVLDTMVRIIDDYRPGMPGAVFLVSDNGKELTGCTAPHLPEVWLSVAARLPIGEMNGSATAAVRSGETTIIADISTDPRCAAVSAVSLEHGLCASWAQPIKNLEGKVLGVFTLYQRERAEPDAHDLALLEEYARLAQMVIERSRLAEALQQSQSQYRLMAENSNDVIWVLQYPSLQYSYISPSVERQRGLAPEELSGHSLADSMLPDSVIAWDNMLEEHIGRIADGDLTGRFIEIELEVSHKDGHHVAVGLVGTIMLDSASRPTHIVGSSRDITRRKAAEETIRKMAFLDQLTNLPNRRMMEDRLGQMLALAKREQRKLSLLFVDLDRFKAVNDQHGHKAGDWLLMQVASRMNAVLRKSDTASRLGGDEFVILLPDTHKTEDAVLVAEKIRSELEKPFVMDQGVVLDISSSIGVVMYPDQADNVRDLLQFGDEAMYRAKKNGRNAVEVFGAPV
ncbi:diguanylate cyclase [Buttiauxella sp.]|uniref:diguanylate cyclase n=1 Tax=Buttiauxella sp. TaxID=1972222 RepID=UPI002B493E68|nr:diguanylate cyclase [Buttiauxella sp.]